MSTWPRYPVEDRGGGAVSECESAIERDRQPVAEEVLFNLEHFCREVKGNTLIGRDVRTFFVELRNVSCIDAAIFLQNEFRRALTQIAITRNAKIKEDGVHFWKCPASLYCSHAGRAYWILAGKQSVNCNASAPLTYADALPKSFVREGFATEMKIYSHWPPCMPCSTFRLRALRTDDAKDLCGYLSDPAVTELTSYPEITESLADAIIDRAASRWAAQELSKWGIADGTTDRIIGTCGFNACSKAEGWAEIAYDLAREHWGKGIMAEALTAVIVWTFLETDIDRISAYVRVDNLRSSALIERLGFLRESTLRNYRICRGVPFDFHVYRLTKPKLETTRTKATGGISDTNKGDWGHFEK